MAETQKYGRSSIRRYLDDGADPFGLLEADWGGNGFGAEVELSVSPTISSGESRTAESTKTSAMCCSAAGTSDIGFQSSSSTSFADWLIRV